MGCDTGREEAPASRNTDPREEEGQRMGCDAGKGGEARIAQHRPREEEGPAYRVRYRQGGGEPASLTPCPWEEVGADVFGV